MRHPEAARTAETGAVRALLSLSLLLFLTQLAHAEAGDLDRREHGVLGHNKTYETPYIALGHRGSDPVVLVQACIHGDEIAGVPAVEWLIRNVSVKHGYLVLLPRMNALACAANKRFINIDLNRVFHTVKRGNQNSFYEYQLARDIYELVGSLGIEYVLTLHESWDRHSSKNSNKFGQTICYGVQPAPGYLKAWLSRLNGMASEPTQYFEPFYAPIPNSSTEVLVAGHRLKGGFCIEVWRGFSANIQTELHKRAVLSFLDTIGLQYVLTTR